MTGCLAKSSARLDETFLKYCPIFLLRDGCHSVSPKKKKDMIGQGEVLMQLQVAARKKVGKCSEQVPLAVKRLVNIFFFSSGLFIHALFRFTWARRSLSVHLHVFFLATAFPAPRCTCPAYCLAAEFALHIWKLVLDVLLYTKRKPQRSACKTTIHSQHFLMSIYKEP